MSARTETITWRLPADEMPDDDLTVLLHLQDEEWPVWPGYHDGDNGWCLADAMPTTKKVLRWAHMPNGGSQ